MFTQNYFEDRVAQGSPVIEKSDKYIVRQVIRNIQVLFNNQVGLGILDA